MHLDSKIKKQIKTNAFYEKYIGRQLLEIEELKKEKELKLSENIDFDKCSGLSNEIKEILKSKKPKNIGEAKQLTGMTTVTANILLVLLKNRVSLENQISLFKSLYNVSRETIDKLSVYERLIVKNQRIFSLVGRAL